MSLFRANTIAQYKIGAWLAKQGITQEEISMVNFITNDTIEITNPAGHYMTLKWAGENEVLILGEEEETQ